MNPNRLNSIFVPLRLTYGLIPLLAGLDKYFNLLTQWPKYVDPSLARLIGLDPATLMHLIGPVEIAVGLLVLTPWVRWGAWVAAAWLTLIAVNLVIAGYLDIAVRDLAMAVGAYSLARLSELRQEAHAGQPALRRNSAVPA